MLSVGADQPDFVCTCSGHVYAASIEAGFSPEGSALQLVLNTIVTAQQKYSLDGLSFTSPEVTRALIQAKQRGIDVRVLLDWKANSAKGSAGVAAMNLLANAGIPVRTVSQFKIMHDKVIITDGRNVETGSFNYSRAAANSNSENALVIRDYPALAGYLSEALAVPVGDGEGLVGLLLSFSSKSTFQSPERYRCANNDIFHFVI